MSDFESTRKYPGGQFIDLCNHCFFSGVSESINADERDDLKESSNDDKETTKDVEEVNDDMED